MEILVFLLTLAVLQLLGDPAEAGEYCYKNGQYEYCSGYCCSSESDYCCSDWGWIAGAVVGGIVFFAIVGSIIFLICHKMKVKKAQTIHVQMLNSSRQPLHSNTHRSSRRPQNQNNTTYTDNYGNGYNTTFLPPPPPYSQTYDQSPAYPPPPPYPGTPLPPSYFTSGGNGAHTRTTHMTSYTHASGDIPYPPPPVS